jgi:hypothetical protein
VKIYALNHLQFQLNFNNFYFYQFILLIVIINLKFKKSLSINSILEKKRASLLKNYKSTLFFLKEINLFSILIQILLKV